MDRWNAAIPLISAMSSPLLLLRQELSREALPHRSSAIPSAGVMLRVKAGTVDEKAEAETYLASRRWRNPPPRGITRPPLSDAGAVFAFEQLGQIHLEYLLGSLETLEQIKRVGPSATDHKRPLALDDFMAEINVALRHSDLPV